MLAACKGHTACVSLLLARQAQLDVQDKLGRTALHHACSKGQYDSVEVLLEHDLDVDIKDETGQTALFKASAAGHATIVLLLLTQTPKIFAPDMVCNL
jgi:ankyrin repeat protein